MTSTNFNIGLAGAEKSSSRVLRPPGGGHSDIFGVSYNEMITPSKKQTQPTLGGCFNMANEENSNTATGQNDNATNGNVEEIIKDEEKNEVDNVTDENKAPTQDKEEIQLKEKEEQTIPTPSRRARVPPGGYSSGLW